MLQTSLLLIKGLNKTETLIFLSVVCSLFSKAIFLTFIVINDFKMIIYCFKWGLTVASMKCLKYFEKLYRILSSSNFFPFFSFKFR